MHDFCIFWSSLSKQLARLMEYTRLYQLRTNSFKCFLMRPQYFSLVTNPLPSRCNNEFYILHFQQLSGRLCQLFKQNTLPFFIVYSFQLAFILMHLTNSSQIWGKNFIKKSNAEQWLACNGFSFVQAPKNLSFQPSNHLPQTPIIKAILSEY